MKILSPAVFVCLCALLAACGGEKKEVSDKEPEAAAPAKEKKAPTTKVDKPAKAKTDIPEEAKVDEKEADEAPKEEGAEGDTKEDEAPDPSEEGDEEEEPGADVGDPELTAGEGISLKSIVLANGVEKIDAKKKPMNPGKVFSLAETERVIAFMSVANPESVETELQVSFLPPESEKERGKVSVSIPAHPKWSTRAFHRVKGPKGVWTVIVRHEDEVIARAPFELTE